MGRVIVKTYGWVETEIALGVLVPKEVTNEVRATLSQEMKTIRNQLLGQVNGAVLKRRQGDLAKSMKARVTFRQGIIRAWAGSKYFTGRLFEDGFNWVPRGAKESGSQRRWSHGRPKSPAAHWTETKRIRKQWAEPIISGKEPELVASLEAAVARGCQKAGF